jgi:hypothetical protein
MDKTADEQEQREDNESMLHDTSSGYCVSVIVARYKETETIVAQILF